MGNKKILTVHSVRRFNERTKYTFSEQQKNSELAFSRGYKLRHFKEPFYSYLNSKQINGGHYSVRVWENNIYIFDNWTQKLVTVYSVPEKYLPYEQFVISQDEKHHCLIRLTSPQGVVEFICEGDIFTDDIGLALEFTSEQKANNYIKNNNNIKRAIKDGYKIDIIPL